MPKLLYLDKQLGTFGNYDDLIVVDTSLLTPDEMQALDDTTANVVVLMEQLGELATERGKEY